MAQRAVLFLHRLIAASAPSNGSRTLSLTHAPLARVPQDPLTGWGRGAREAAAKLQKRAQDLGKARDPIMGCLRPARGAASSLAKLLRRPRCTLRGARMTACTALQIRIGFVDLGRRNCSACMRKAWCHQCAYPVAIGAPNSSPRLLRTSPSARVGCMHAHHGIPLYMHESALYRARCCGRALRNEDAGCISCALRSVWRSVWSFSLVGRADAVCARASTRRDEKCPRKVPRPTVNTRNGTT
jgi:hypothetical protein